MSLATQNSLKNDNPYGQDRPIQMNCPFCKNNIISEITQQNSWVSFIIVSIVFVVTNFIVALFAVPLFLIFTKQRVHHCSVCSNELGRDTRIFSAFDLHDDLISCKCGEFGFIVTRKVMLGITAFIILIGLIVLKIQNLKNIDLDDAPDYTDASWLEFKDQCGRDQLQDYNNLINCHKQYLDRSVYHWKGKMLKMLKSQNNQGRMYKKLSNIRYIYNKPDANISSHGQFASPFYFRKSRGHNDIFVEIYNKYYLSKN